MRFAFWRRARPSGSPCEIRADGSGWMTREEVDRLVGREASSDRVGRVEAEEAAVLAGEVNDRSSSPRGGLGVSVLVDLRVFLDEGEAAGSVAPSGVPADGAGGVAGDVAALPEVEDLAPVGRHDGTLLDVRVLVKAVA